MGGLLDKANAAKDTEETESPMLVPEHCCSCCIGIVVINSPTDPRIRRRLVLLSWVIILLGAIISLQGGAWGFAVVAIVLVLGIGVLHCSG